MKLITLFLACLLSLNICANDFLDKGKAEFFKDNYSQAVKWYKKAADQGGYEAQELLGFLYALGQGVPQDYKQAVKWFQKAAKQGYKHAQFTLGQSYFNGRSVTQDYKQAFKWHTKAAEQGLHGSQTMLGNMYEEGKGVMPNNKRAYAWYALGAIDGNKNAILFRDVVAERLSPSGLEQAQELAAELYDKISNNK